MRIVLLDGSSETTRGDILVDQYGNLQFTDKKGAKRRVPVHEVLEIKEN